MASNPTDFLQELARWYPFSALSAGITIAVAAFWRPLALMGSRRSRRQAFDSTWFLAVYVWGIESINRLTAILTGNDGSHGGANHFLSTAAVTSSIVLSLILLACISAETLGSQRNLPARSVGSVPLPVVAGVAAVIILWSGALVGLNPP